MPLSLMECAGWHLNRFVALKSAADIMGFTNHGLTCFAITA
jgi:hypothetical protein